MLKFLKKLQDLRHQLIYNQVEQVPAETVEAESPAETFEDTFTSVEFGLTKEFKEELEAVKTPEELSDLIRDKVDSQFGPKKYAEEFEKYIRGKLPSKTDADKKKINRLVKEAVARYTPQYENDLAKFYRSTEDLVERYRDLGEQRREHTRADLSLMKDQVERMHATDKAKQQIETFDTGEETMDEGVIEDQFSTLMESLNNQYLNREFQEQRLEEGDFEKYEDLADTFEDGMENYVETQLDHILTSHAAKPDPDLLKKRLEGLRDHLKYNYEERFSNEEGFIDLQDLKRLRKEASQHLDLLESFNEEGQNVNQVTAQLDSLNFFNRERLTEHVGKLSEGLIESVKSNGTAADFTAAIRAITKRNDISDFDDASDAFEDLMEEKAELGVREVVELVSEINNKVNKERIKILKLDHIPETAIHNRVHIERERLLGLPGRRRTIPRAIDGRLVAEFMSTNLEGRNEMLSDPMRKRALFQAIRNIQVHYQERYDTEYSKEVPENRGEIVKNDRNLRKPTQHDQIARLLALITLSKEAEWVINNLSKSDIYTKKGQPTLAEQLEETDHDPVKPKLDMKFLDANAPINRRYVSRVAQGGFNGRDLFLTALKVWGITTAVINLLGVRKMEDLEGMVKATVTNPYIAAGAGAFWAANKVQKRPEMAGYPTETEGGRERLGTINSLDGLAKKVGGRRLKAFIHNEHAETEYLAMSTIMKREGGVEDLEALRDQAVEDNSAYPTLSRDALRDILGNDAIYTQMPEGRQGDRMRYLFYEKFLTEPRRMNTFWEHCKKWK